MAGETEQIVQMTLNGVDMTVRLTAKTCASLASLLVDYARHHSSSNHRNPMANVLKKDGSARVIYMSKDEYKTFSKKAGDYFPYVPFTRKDIDNLVYVVFNDSDSSLVHSTLRELSIEPKESTAYTEVKKKDIQCSRNSETQKGNHLSYADTREFILISKKKMQEKKIRSITNQMKRMKDLSPILEDAMMPRKMKENMAIE